ncbi:MAG: hypothetical protein EON58_16730 [Alphaproteobacteria bacterium]|nr:MAG: hypothetical protein EON58_16730 [Alphaproteobacteria bacterium]
MAFDKHAMFCEEYIAAVYQTLSMLFKEGPTSEALGEGWKLTEIRRKYAAWLSESMEDKLVLFENALKEMGAAGVILDMRDADIDRGPHIKNKFLRYAEIMGSSFSTYQGEDFSRDLTVNHIVGHLRSLLGVEPLTRLRQRILEMSNGGA